MNIRYMEGADTYKNIAVGAYEKIKETETLGISADDKDCAVIMNISSQGYEKSRNMQTEEMEAAYEPKQTGSFEVVGEQPASALMHIVKEGGTLTQEEEARLEKEMRQMIQYQYDWALELRLSEKDEEVLNAMKNEYLMKQRTLQDMQEKIEIEKLENETKELEAESARSVRGYADRLGEARMLERTLDSLNNGDEKNRNSIKPEDTVSRVKEENQNAGNTSGAAESNDVNARPMNKALFMAHRDEDNLNALGEEKKKAVEKEKEFSKLLDEDFERTMLVFDSGELSMKEKISAYENFLQTSDEFAKGREIERNKRLFDFRTIREAKIASYANHNIQDAWEQTERQLQERSAAVFEEAGQDYITKDTEERIQEIEEQKRYEKQYRAYSETYGKEPDEEDEEQQPG